MCLREDNDDGGHPAEKSHMYSYVETFITCTRGPYTKYKANFKGVPQSSKAQANDKYTLNECLSSVVSGSKYISVLEFSEDQLSGKSIERSYNTSSICGIKVRPGRFVWLYNPSPPRDFNSLIYPTKTWGCS